MNISGHLSVHISYDKHGSGDDIIDFSPLRENFSEETKTYIYILCHSSTLTWHR